jgi:hypothetical protein
MVKYKQEDTHFSISPLPPQTSKLETSVSFMEKPQALIDLMQSIIQTHKPTWTDCQQLLLTIFNTEE